MASKFYKGYKFLTGGKSRPGIVGVKPKSGGVVDEFKSKKLKSLGKTQRKLIESNDAIVHFGNFGFKTNNKSFVLIQNILPFVSKDLKNIVLRKFISRRFF